MKDRITMKIYRTFPNTLCVSSDTSNAIPKTLIRRRQCLYAISGLSAITTMGFFGLLAFSTGCASQKGQLLDADDPMRIGSHQAGSEIFDPATENAVRGLLARVENSTEINTGTPRRICFVGVENASAEEMGDIKQDLNEMIRTQITQSPCFETIDSRAIASGLRQTNLRGDDLLLPENRAKFNDALGGMGKAFDYILFAKVTTATTRDNADSQVKYSLTLDLVDVQSGATAARESVALRKNYNRTAGAKLRGMF